MRRKSRRRPVGASGHVFALTLLALTLGVASSPRAEPYMAIREGRKCGTCHVNQTGGGMRTLLAMTHMKEITHYREIFPEFMDATDVWNGQITDFFSIGGDFRVADSIIFQDEPNAEGQVPHKALRGRVDENILDIREAALYFDIQLVPDFLSVYTDVDFAPGSPVAREAFAMLQGVIPGKGYVKGGRFYVDYGLKIETDNLFSVGLPSQDAFVRGRTGTGFTGYDAGLELGFQPGPWHFSVSVTDPAEGDTGVRVTTNAYGVWRDIPVIENALFGGSFLFNDPRGGEQYMWALYGGANLGNLEYQAEVDFIHEKFSGGTTTNSLLVYGELNYLLFDWINAKVFGEYADNDGIVAIEAAQRSDTAQNRFGFGIEPFLGEFLQTRLFYSIANGPKDIPEANQNRLVIELHVFF